MLHSSRGASAQRKSVQFSEAVEELGCADDYDRTPVPMARLQAQPVAYMRGTHAWEHGCSGSHTHMHGGQAATRQQEYVQGTWADMFLSMDTFTFC